MKNISKKNTSEGFELVSGLLVLGAISLLGLGVWWFVSNLGKETLNIIFGFLDLLVGVLVNVVTVFFNMVAKLAAVVINSFIILNPFGQISIAPLLWEFFKNISYVVLVFLSLWAGFQFILNKEDEARRLLIGILIIAFLINFTYVLAKEFFLFFWHLTASVLNLIGNVTDVKGESYTSSNFGEILLASLAFFLGENAKTIGEKIQQEMRSISGVDEQALVKRGIALSFGLFSLTMAFIGTALMCIFAGIAFGKFFIISFLVGVLPLACIAYLLPNQKKYFDQWWHLFLTWNINLLILIVLIIIGIFLFASTNSESIFKIENFLDTKKNIILGNDIEEIAQLAGPIISLSLRFIVISVYYILVIVLALNMGGRFAKAGYDFAKWTWTKTGSLIYDQAKGLAAGPLNRLGDKMTNLANTLAQYRGPAALLAKKIRSAGETLKKPAKERDKEIAGEAWEAAKNKSPEEIAKIANRLRGGELTEFANLINKYKSPDEIFKVFINSKALQEDPKIRKILCGEKLNCALDTIMKGNPEDRAKAVQLLAQRLDFTKTNLGDFEKLLTGLGVNIQEKRGLLRTLTDYLTDRNARNFFAHPDNLTLLKKSGLTNILQENQEIIRQTPTFRIFQDSIDEILTKLKIDDPQLRSEIREDFLKKYLGGEITQEEINKWKGGQMGENIKNILDNKKSNNESKKSEIENQISQYEQQISARQNELNELQEKIDSKKREVEDIEKSISEGKIITLAEETVEQAIQRLNKRKEELAQQINSDLETKNSLENELNNLINKNNELQNLRQQLEERISKITDIQTTISQLSFDDVDKILQQVQTILENPMITTPIRRKLTEGPEREDIEEIIREMREKETTS